MDRLLYISATGMAHVDRAQTLHANNLANVSTTGFRADLARVMTDEVVGAGYQSRAYGVTTDGGVDLALGGRIDTGRDLDIAINGDGFIAVRLPDGQEGYTRDGSLQVDAFGRLLTQQGFEVLSEEGPIVVPPYENLLIGSDGSITVRPEGQGGEALAQIDRIKLVEVAGGELRKDGSGVLVTELGGPRPANPQITVTSGVLESSNVNAIHELSQIISLARQFEMQVQMMRNAEENDQATSQLLRIN